MTPAAPCPPRPKRPRRHGCLPPESTVSSAGAVDATGEVEVLLGGAGQDADEHDPAGVDGYDLGHGRVRLLIADDHIVTDTEHDSGLDVADVGVGETVAVGAVIVHPEIPLHRPTS